jgi:serine/threonine protein kinase
MLQLDPNRRITAKEALEHEYLKSDHLPLRCNPEDLPKIEKDSHEFQSRIKQKAHQQNQQMQGQRNMNLNQRNDVMVGRGTYHNPQYYNRNMKVHETKIKIEETHNNSNSFMNTTSSRLEALIPTSIKIENKDSQNLLNNKRQSEIIDLNQPQKKQKSEFSPDRNNN